SAIFSLVASASRSFSAATVLSMYSFSFSHITSRCMATLVSSVTMRRPTSSERAFGATSGSRSATLHLPLLPRPTNRRAEPLRRAPVVLEVGGPYDALAPVARVRLQRAGFPLRQANHDISHRRLPSRATFPRFVRAGALRARRHRSGRAGTRRTGKRPPPSPGGDEKTADQLPARTRRTCRAASAATRA